jgi:hypothetical protein
VKISGRDLGYWRGLGEVRSHGAAVGIFTSPTGLSPAIIDSAVPEKNYKKKQ